MAKIGASNVHFALMTGDDSFDKLPSYESGFKFGKLMTLEDSPNYTQGDIYGDDVMDDEVDEFTEADITLSLTTLTAEQYAKIFGITPDEDGTLADPSDASVPFGGLACVQTLRRNGVPTFRAFFYPKVKARVEGVSLASKQKNLSFNGEGLKFKAFKPYKEGSTWRYRNEFKTLPEAVAWLKTKLNITEAAATSEPDTGSGS